MVESSLTGVTWGRWQILFGMGVFLLGLMAAGCLPAPISAGTPPASPPPLPATKPLPNTPVATPTAVTQASPESTAVPKINAESAVYLPIVVTPIYYVAVNGSDAAGGGSEENPWATISHALDNVPDGVTILVRPGTYNGQVDLRGAFTRGVIVRSEQPYQARLRHNDTVLVCFRGKGITLEGFDISHSGPGAARYVIQIQDLIGSQSGGANYVSRITLRNNIIHDSYNDDLVKVNNGAGQIIITGNIFYNQQGLDSHIDANSVTDVTIEDNIFFNDFAASGRPNNNDTGSYIVIKDSNGNSDTNLGSKNITVRRNVFLNWEGDSGNTFIVVGEDTVSYYQAQNVLVENNLMLGNGANVMHAAFHVRGSKDITFRNNTVVGDLPSKAFAMRLSIVANNLNNVGINFYNNIWSDPTGTMGSGNQGEPNDFSDTNLAQTDSFSLLNNLYWNGAAPIPLDAAELVNYTDDGQRIISDPLLGGQTAVSLPYWNAITNSFADGSATITEAFAKLVQQYGIPVAGSPVIDAADPAHAPADDIMGQPRSIGPRPDIGAFEQ